MSRLKKLTLPRPELMACLIAARLPKIVKQCLMLNGSVMCTYWTDSTIVLSRINGDPGIWEPFVLNRVR